MEDESDEAIRKKAAELNAGPSAAARALFVPYNVDLDNPATRKAASVNVHMRLLMRLLNWEFEPGQSPSLFTPRSVAVQNSC